MSQGLSPEHGRKRHVPGSDPETRPEASTSPEGVGAEHSAVVFEEESAAVATPEAMCGDVRPERGNDRHLPNAGPAHRLDQPFHLVRRTRDVNDPGLEVDAGPVTQAAVARELAYLASAFSRS